MPTLRPITSALLVVTLLVTTTFAKSIDKLKIKQHAAMHEIVMVDRDDTGKIIDGGLCTAYAVGPHTLLTAEHCNDPKANSVYVDVAVLGTIKDNTAIGYTIVSRTLDKQDHMLLTVSGVTFTITIPMEFRTPVQGEATYQWGNPGGMRDQYRQGIVMGHIPNPTDADVDASGDIWLIAEPVIGGDSGSAIFSAKDGALIGVLTFGIDDGQVAGMYALAFTPAQIAAAI